MTDKLLKTVHSIGKGNWKVTCLGNTNVMKAGHLHHLHNTIGNINKFPKLKFANYFVAFTLDPRYSKSEFLKKPTVNMTTIVIPALSQETGHHTLLPYLHAYTCVKDFLKEQLQKDLANYVTNPNSALPASIFKVLSVAEIASGLCHQTEAFWHDEWPFNQQVKDGNPLAWWESLQNHPHAHVLAMKSNDGLMKSDGLPEAGYSSRVLEDFWRSMGNIRRNTGEFWRSTGKSRRVSTAQK
ncbi:hypothetical protein F4604DRAFT_1689823 [Suillus subluteus]|nr:hypothetical protein F4604DRAFT_1689823 [Suillus subluteus]